MVSQQHIRFPPVIEFGSWRGGKIYLEANGSGVILKSPGGACFELTVTDAGALTIAVVTCP